VVITNSAAVLRCCSASDVVITLYTIYKGLFCVLLADNERAVTDDDLMDLVTLSYQ
jgi:hypothetical protein